VSITDYNTILHLFTFISKQYMQLFHWTPVWPQSKVKLPLYKYITVLALLLNTTVRSSHLKRPTFINYTGAWIIEVSLYIVT